MQRVWFVPEHGSQAKGETAGTGSLRCMTFHPNHQKQGIRTHTLQIILTPISTQCPKALNKAFVQGHLCRHRHLLIYDTSPEIWNMEQLLMQTKFLLNKTQNKWSIWEQKEWKQLLLCSCPDARVETHELYSYHPLQGWIPNCFTSYYLASILTYKIL